MKNFFSNSIPLIILAGSLLLLPVGGAQAVITRVSVDSAGGQANNFNNRPSISADGRYVTFASSASNLVVGDTNNENDIFVHDRQTAITTRVSVDSAGGQANQYNSHPSLSADGRYVAFVSYADNLVSGDTNHGQGVFVHDRQTATTTRVSVDTFDSEGNPRAGFDHSSISADGRYVAFISYPNTKLESPLVFVHDRQTATTTLLGEGVAPSISADGRFVVVTSGFVPFFGQGRSLVLYNIQLGTKTVVYQGGVSVPSISADGRFVAFSALGPVRVIDRPLAAIYVYDRLSGTTELLGGWEGTYSHQPSISGDGRFVTLVRARDLGGRPGPLSAPDLFVHDRLTAATTYVSGAESLTEVPSVSTPPFISADGRFVAVESRFANLIPGDTNGVKDIFVHRLPCDSDIDCDGIPDTMDNCIYQQNGPLAPPGVGSRSQRDTNGDGFGNVCDADLNNNGLITAADYAILRSRLNTANADADLNGDGQVTPADFQILRSLLNTAPGPSGLVP